MWPLWVGRVAIHLDRDSLPRIWTRSDSHRLRVYVALHTGGKSKCRRDFKDPRKTSGLPEFNRGVLWRGAAKDSSTEH